MAKVGKPVVSPLVFLYFTFGYGPDLLKALLDDLSQFCTQWLSTYYRVLYCTPEDENLISTSQSVSISVVNESKGQLPSESHTLIQTSL